MNQTNLIKHEKTIDIVKANIYSLPLIAVLLLIFGSAYYFLWKPHISLSLFLDFNKSENPVINMLSPLLLVAVIFMGIALHELVHGITWSFYTKKGFGAIKFGILWKYVTPYCHCDEPLKPKHFITGAIMPTVVVGVIPALAALITGNISLLLFGILFIASGIGDMIIIWELLKEKDVLLVEDHPTKVGFYVYRKITY